MLDLQNPQPHRQPFPSFFILALKKRLSWCRLFEPEEEDERVGALRNHGGADGYGWEGDLALRSQQFSG